MARTSSGKTGAKRKHAGVRNGKGRSPAAKAQPSKSKALRAKGDPVRKQDLQESSIEGDVRSDHAALVSPGLEWIRLMGRTVSATFSLPIGMTRCSTPFEVWSEHNKFLQGIAKDCQAVAFRMMGATSMLVPSQPSSSRARRAGEPLPARTR